MIAKTYRFFSGTKNLSVGSILFILSFNVCIVVLGLLVTFCRFAMGGIFTTNIYAEHKTFGNHKTVCGERNPAYCKCAVMCSLYFVRHYNSFFTQPIKRSNSPFFSMWSIVVEPLSITSPLSLLVTICRFIIPS